MTQLYFIALLCVYAVVVTLSLLADKVVAQPAGIRKAKLESEENFKRKIKRYPVTVAFIGGVGIGFGAVGFIGMFFLWHVAPYLFAIAIFFKVFLSPRVTMFWQIINGWEMMLFHIEFILDGVILMLVFFGPARHLFFQ